MPRSTWPYNWHTPTVSRRSSRLACSPTPSRPADLHRSAPATPRTSALPATARPRCPRRTTRAIRRQNRHHHQQPRCRLSIACLDSPARTSSRSPRFVVPAESAMLTPTYSPILPHTTRPLGVGVMACNRSTTSLYRRQANRASCPNCDRMILTFARLTASSLSSCACARNLRTRSAPLYEPRHAGGFPHAMGIRCAPL